MDIRQFFFKYRGFTPVPLVLTVIYFARPTVESFLLGLLIMVVGESLRLWGVSYAGGATRTRNVGAPRLVTAGPFSRVRNPLYLGNMIIYTGAALIANVWMPWLIFVVWIFFGIQYYLIVQLEEGKLSELFGEEYLEYKKRVPRFIPRFIPVTTGNQVKPDIPGAIRSEKSTFISFAVILLLFVGKMIFFPKI
ncbi:MAG: hypothetical protein Kow0042_07770 [Calditrichia bacterium]